MRMITKTSLLFSLAILASRITGCNSSDEQFAQQSMANQRQQNELIANQSAAVVQESSHIAEGAKELVTRDAQARQELILAQKQAHEQLHEERASVDRQREALDGERRDIAETRVRDPIVGAAIQGAIELIACLSPLVLAAYALRQLGRASSAPVELGELLLNEFTSSQPTLLPATDKPRLLG
jgi:hypothetical protein